MAPEILMEVAVKRRRFDVDEYHRMGEAGILGEDDRVELIEGEILAMTPIRPPHHASVDRINRILVRAVGDRAIVRVQGSIRLSRYTEPQPDVVLLRPEDDFYASRMAEAPDTLLVIEVAQSSLKYDRVLKARLYAESGVPEYWIVDLPARVVVRHTSPRDRRYEDVREYPAAESIAPAALPDCVIAVRDMLP